MKKKIVIIFLVSALLTFIIYNVLKNDKLSYVSLGDGVAEGMTAYNVEGYSYADYIRDYLEEKSLLKNYIKGFTQKDQRAADLTSLIEQNAEISIKQDVIPIKQVLAKADIITLSIGMDELFIKKEITEKYRQNYLKDMNKLLTTIRSLSKKEIILIGLYPTDELQDYVTSSVNKELEVMVKSINGNFIDPSNALKNRSYFPDSKSPYFSYKGHDALSKEILLVIEKTI